MDLRTAVIHSLDNVIASGAIEAEIEKRIGQTIAEVIKSEISTYSDFGKRISESVKASLRVGEDMGLPAYNDLVLKIVRKTVDAQIGGALQKQVATQMAELLVLPPAEIKISELAKEFGEFANQNYLREGSDRFTFGMEESEYSAGNYHLWFDAKKAKSQYESQHRFSIDQKGKVYSLTVDRQDAEKRLFIGPLYGFERLLFQIKVAGTKVIRDCSAEDIDTHYPEQECHC